jgi:hypothetical protein
MMDMRADLRFICATVDANLRYAESKHAYLVAFNGMAIFGGFGVLRNLSASSGGIQAMLVITMLLLILAIITSLYSFLPRIVKITEDRPPARGDNALFLNISRSILSIPISTCSAASTRQGWEISCLWTAALFRKLLSTPVWPRASSPFSGWWFCLI